MDAESSIARFDVPDVEADSTAQFRLTVTDAEGASATADVAVAIDAVVLGQAVLGPIVGATVEVFDASMPNAPALFTTQTIDGASLDRVGLFAVPIEFVDGDGLYVLRVTGGEDVDPGDDGTRDSSPTPHRGTLRALASREELRAGTARVNALTELAYAGVRTRLLLGEDAGAITDALDAVAVRLLENDVNGDGRIDRRDLLAFRPREDGASFRGGRAALQRVALSILEDRLDANDARGAGFAPSIAEFSGGASLFAAAVAGDLLFTITADEDIEIRDISDVQALQFLAGIALTEQVTAFAASPELLLVGTRPQDGGVLEVIDVSDPRAPRLVGSLAGFGFIVDIAIRGRTAYIADAGVDFAVVDLTLPSQPVQVGSLRGRVRSVELLGDTVFAASGNFGVLRVIDVSTPSLPVNVTNLDLGIDEFFTHTALSGGTLFYAVDRLLGAIDVSDPLNPRIIDTLQTRHRSGGLEVVGDTVVVYEQDFGLRLYDVSDPSALAEIGRIDVPNRFPGPFAVIGDEVLVGDNQILRRVSLGSVEPPLAAAGFDALTAVALEEQGARVAYATVDGEFGILDTTDFVAPRVVGSLALGQGALALEWEGSLAAVSTANQVSLIDTSDETRPALVGTARLDGFASDIQMVGPLLFANSRMSFDYTLEYFDLTDPSLPVKIGELALPQTNRAGFAVRGDVLVVDSIRGSDRGIEVYDIADLNAPALRSFFVTGGEIGDVQFHTDDVIYVSAEGRFEVLDVSDPASPQRLASVPLFDRQLRGAAVRPPLVAQTLIRDGIAYLDASDPLAPTLLGEFRLDEWAFDAVLGEAHVLVASEIGGLRIYRLPPSEEVGFD